jgi:hypothetical protein
VRTTTRKPHGPPPLARRRINPKLYDAVRASGTPGWKLAILAGLTHQTVLSSLVCAESIPDTVTNIERLQRIADVVGFDRGQLFLDGGR